MGKCNTFLYTTTCDNYIQAFKKSTIYWHYLWKISSGKGLDRNELLLKRAHFSKDISKFLATVADFAFGSSFMTLIPHLEGEEVFSSTKHNSYFSPRVSNELHRPNHVKFSCPRVAIPTCHPNNVNNLHIHGSPCVTQNMFFITFSRWHNGQWDYMWGWSLTYWSVPF